MAEDNIPYVLAMYDVRGKQEFIFRTNKLNADIFDDMVIKKERIQSLLLFI